MLLDNPTPVRVVFLETFSRTPSRNSLAKNNCLFGVCLSRRTFVLSSAHVRVTIAPSYTGANVVTLFLLPFLAGSFALQV